MVMRSIALLDEDGGGVGCAGCAGWREGVVGHAGSNWLCCARTVRKDGCLGYVLRVAEGEAGELTKQSLAEIDDEEERLLDDLVGCSLIRFDTNANTCTCTPFSQILYIRTILFRHHRM